MSEIQVGEMTVDQRELLEPRRLRALIVGLMLGVTCLVVGVEFFGHLAPVDAEPSGSAGQLNLALRELPGGVAVEVPDSWEIRHAQVDCFAFGTSPALSWGVGYPSGSTLCLPGWSSAPGVLVMLDVLVQPEGDARPAGGDWKAILDPDGSAREFFSPCHELAVRTSGLSSELERSVLASVASGAECS